MILIHLGSERRIFHGVSNIEDFIWVSAEDTFNNIYLSPDMGNTWIKTGVMESGHFFRLWDIEFSDPNNGWATGELGLIYHSSNGGLTWVRQSYGATKYFTRIKFRNSEMGWAVGGDNLYAKTWDGGENWEVGFIPSPLVTDLYGISFLNESLVVVIGGVAVLNPGGQGLIARSENLGGAWKIVDTSSVYDYFDVFFIDSQTGYVGGGTDTMPYIPVLLRSQDGGMTWEEVSLPPGTHTLRALHFPDAKHGWAVGELGTAIFTVDGGLNWEPVSMPTQVTLFDVEFADSMKGVIVGDSGVVYVTEDGGNTWILKSPVEVRENPFERAKKPQIEYLLKDQIVLSGLPQVSDYYIFGINGRVYKKGRLAEPMSIISLKGLPQGVFILRVENQKTLTFPFLHIRN